MAVKETRSSARTGAQRRASRGVGPHGRSDRGDAPGAQQQPDEGRGEADLPDLETALADCRRAAREGFRIAQTSLSKTDAAIEDVSRSLKRSVRDINEGCADASDVVVQLQEQLRQVVTELHDLQSATRASMEDRRKDLDEFSIALFGRTMAGKSTLMEILTNGSGESIGKGAQRTTRDIRNYHWRGLRVTDVPGVAAFEGAEDEELAFEAASKADLVLFLITDDAPQQVEAECLARVRALGKPVLGVCNVKVTIDDDDDLLLFLRAPDKWFDMRRLGALVRQFHEFADRYNPGYRVRFAYTHLLSRYLAGQSQHQQHRRELDRASRFQLVERAIITEVAGRGKFLRAKSFVDGAVAPMLELADRLLEFSAQNSSSGRVLVDKKRQAISWAQEFRRSGRERIDAFVSRHVDGLREEIPSFAEDNYDRSDAGERWSSFVEQRGVRRAAENLQKTLQSECQTALSELARELEAELELVGDFAGDRRVSMDSLFDSKRAWNWGTNILVGGLGLAALILGSTPLGWAAAAVGAVGWLVSLFMDDREVKAKRQRNKLEKRLTKNVDKIERGLRKSLGDWFHQGLLRDQVGVLLDDLSVMTSGLFELADAQRKLAWTLNKQLKALHRILLRQALEQLGLPGLEELALDVARIPGLAVMLVIEPGTTFPGEARAGLEELLGEKVWFVVDTGDKASMLSQAIGRNCDRRRVSIESKIQVAHVPIGELDAVGVSRIRLAQQLTELHVMR